MVVFCTLSKAWAAAGLRVGYALGDARVIWWLRAAGQPYAVSAPSLIAARRLLSKAQGIGSQWRGSSGSAMESYGIAGARSGGDGFPGRLVLVRFRMRNGRSMLSRVWGWVRSFPGKPRLEAWLRITIPSEESLADRLLASIRSALRPEALLFDLDGVLADVSQSYRLAIVQTASAFGVELGPAELQRPRQQETATTIGS